MRAPATLSEYDSAPQSYPLHVRTNNGQLVPMRRCGMILHVISAKSSHTSFSFSLPPD